LTLLLCLYTRLVFHTPARIFHKNDENRSTLQQTNVDICASISALNQVPLVLHGIDGRYATALFSAASKQKALEKVENDLNNLKTLLESDKKVAWFLETPTIDRQKKQKVVDVLLEKGKYSPIVSNFLGVLAENGRLNETEKVISAFGQLMVAVRGEVSVVVTSAKELDQKTLSKIKDSLNKNQVAGEGKKLMVSNKVRKLYIGKSTDCWRLNH
jgi:F-type H+-transporting ATPase subunit O